MAYEYAIRGCHVFALTWIVRRSAAADMHVNLVALREATEDQKELTLSRWRYDCNLWNLIPI